jgi:hypothetical protein
MVAVPASGQEIELGGQIRPRFEYRNPTSAGTRDAFTSMRIRASLAAELDGGVNVFVQLQDVRLFGEEEHTLLDFSADGLDLHQGYLEVVAPIDETLRVRVGREELNLGGQRLVGAVGWSQPGRSFDGARVAAGAGSAGVQLFGYRLQQATSTNHDHDAIFAGAYGDIDLSGATLEPYGLYNNRRSDEPTSQGTVGARVHGERSNIRYRAEGSYQFGRRAGSNVTAFVLGARLGTTLAGGLASVTLWYDYLSGDNDPNDGTSKVFDTLFATNHKFYGFADLFLDIPLHTGGLGLQDLALKGSIRPWDPFTASLAIHSFRTAAQGSLTTRRLGEEIDVTLAHRYSTNLRVSGGLAYVFQGAGLSELGRLDRDMVWTYLMLDVTF